MEAKASEIFNGYRNFFYRTMQFVFFCFFLIVFSPSTLTAAPQFGGLQTTKVGSNKGSISVRYDQLGLSVGDVVVVSVTADNSAHQSVIVQGAGHPGGTTVYNASDTTAVQPRLRVDVLVYDGSWPSKLNYTFAVPDNETWIAYVTKWTGVDTTNPVAGSAGNFNGVTLNPTSPGLTAPENDLVAIAVYGAREDDFAANGTPAGYTPLAIGASNIGKSGSSSGIAYKGGISAGSLPAAVWTQAAATHVHAAHVLLRSDDGTPPPTPIFADNFNDGNAIGWSVDDECQKGNSNWSVVNNVLMQTDDCRGFTVAEGAAVGTQVLSNVSLPAGVDITVRLRSEDPDSDAASNNNGAGWKFGNLGVLFGYQDANNYYRFEFNGLKGHRKLWRKQGGAFTELNTSPQSFVRGQWMVLRIVHRNGVILVFVDGQQVMSAADTAFSAGGLGLFCARDTSCSFDDVSVLSASTDPQLGLRLLDSAAPTEPALPVQSYGEYFVDSDSVLEVVAVATAATGVGGVEFVVDEGTGNAVSQTDLVAPYRRQFTTLSTGEHTVTGYLLDGSGVRLTAPEARVSLPQIATNGIHLYTQGDSITAGLKDDVTADDTSLDTRNTAGGYQPVLNDELSAGNGVPVTVLNDGNAGEESGEGAARMASILSHSPEAQAYVMFYGANDSGGALPTPSGLGTVPDTVTPVTFKDYLQQMINAVTGAGKQIYLVKATPFLANLTRDALVVEYNQVVDELVSENGLGYVAADLYSYFTANPGEFSPDLLHPNGTGYASIARLICEQLNGQNGLWCLDDDGDGLVNSFENLIGTDPLLIDTDGDGLVDGDDGIVLISAVSGGVDNDGDGFADGEQAFGTDPLLMDSDGDQLGDGLEVANNADPLDPNNWPNLADGDIAPLGSPDGSVNAGDILIGVRISLGLVTPTALELAHGDLYPVGAPDGIINLQDLILLQKIP